MDYINYNSMEKLKFDPKLLALGGELWMLRSEKDPRYDFIFKTSIDLDQRSDWLRLKVKVGDEVTHVYVRKKDVAGRLQIPISEVEKARVEGTLEKLMQLNLLHKTLNEPDTLLTGSELEPFKSDFPFDLETGGVADQIVKDSITTIDILINPKTFRNVWFGRLKEIAACMAASRLGDQPGAVEPELEKMTQEFALLLVNDEETAKFAGNIFGVSEVLEELQPNEDVPEDLRKGFLLNKYVDFLKNPTERTGGFYLYEAFVTYWLNKGFDKAVQENLLHRDGETITVAIASPKDSALVLKLAKDLEAQFIKAQEFNKGDERLYGPKLRMTALYIALKLNFDIGWHLDEHIETLEAYNITVGDLKTMETTFLKGINWDLNPYLALK